MEKGKGVVGEEQETDAPAPSLRGGGAITSTATDVATHATRDSTASTAAAGGVEQHAAARGGSPPSSPYPPPLPHATTDEFIVDIFNSGGSNLTPTRVDARPVPPSRHHHRLGIPVRRRSCLVSPIRRPPMPVVLPGPHPLDSASRGSSTPPAPSSRAMPPREPWRLEDADAELKLREEKLCERKKELDHLEEEARKQRNKYRVEMEEKVADHRHKALIKDEELSLLEIDLYRRELDVAAWEEEVQDRVREAELQRRWRELKFRNDATERQARALASELKKPLLQTRPEAERKDKEDDTWNKRQNYATMALVAGLTILFQIRFDLPPDHFTLILRSFAVLWLLGSVIFPSGFVGTHKLEVEFSRHVGRLTFMCLSLLVLYALYLMLLPGHGTPRTCPPPSAVTSPLPSAVTPSREVQSNLGFFIALGVLAIIGHIAFWVMDGVKESK